MELSHKFSSEFYSEEEKMFKVAPSTKKLWAALLDLLLEFDRVCKENDIKYMVDAGTLLGAARHGGIIPWDDDIDVIMLRDEYEKLNKIGPVAFKHPYFWQTYETDPDHGRAFGRLRNSTTTFMPKFEMMGGKSCFHHNQGVLMDVFVADNVPDDLSERHDFLKCIAKRHRMSWRLREVSVTPWAVSDFWYPSRFIRKLHCLITQKFLRHNTIAKSQKWIDTFARKYNATRTQSVSHVTFCPYEGQRYCITFPRKFIEELTTMNFEGFDVPVTKYYDEYLTMIYKDWRKYVVAPSYPEGVFIDLDHPYTDYLLK